MLGSSLTLAKAAGDLPTLVTAARGQLRMFLDTPGEQVRLVLSRLHEWCGASPAPACSG